jgi:hypothetical protein
MQFSLTQDSHYVVFPYNQVAAFYNHAILKKNLRFCSYLTGYIMFVLLLYVPK